MQRAAPVVPVPIAPSMGWAEWLLPLALTALAYAVVGAIGTGTAGAARCMGERPLRS